MRLQRIGARSNPLVPRSHELGTLGASGLWARHRLSRRRARSRGAAAGHGSHLLDFEFFVFAVARRAALTRVVPVVGPRPLAPAYVHGRRSVLRRRLASRRWASRADRGRRCCGSRRIGRSRCAWPARFAAGHALRGVARAWSLRRCGLRRPSISCSGSCGRVAGGSVLQGSACVLHGNGGVGRPGRRVAGRPGSASGRQRQTLLRAAKGQFKGQG